MAADAPATSIIRYPINEATLPKRMAPPPIAAFDPAAIVPTAELRSPAEERRKARDISGKRERMSGGEDGRPEKQTGQRVVAGDHQQPGSDEDERHRRGSLRAEQIGDAPAKRSDGDDNGCKEQKDESHSAESQLAGVDSSECGEALAAREDAKTPVNDLLARVRLSPDYAIAQAGCALRRRAPARRDRARAGAPAEADRVRRAGVGTRCLGSGPNPQPVQRAAR